MTKNGSFSGATSDWWESDDSDDDSDWGEDEWPLDHPIPLPKWGCDRPELKFDDEGQYQEFLNKATSYLQQCLASLPYDTLSNFFVFSTKYVYSRDEYSNLKDFFRDYDTPLIPGCFTCVGLALDLSSRLSHMEKMYPGIKDAMYQVSCEETVKNIDEFCTELPPPRSSLIEHVLLCIKIRISGRAGVTLFDPGYHVSQPITVMEDGLAPQSDTIMGSSTRHDVVRTSRYNYLPGSSTIIAWTTREERPGKPDIVTFNRIHPKKPFLSCVDIAERRNLIYGFKSLLGRDSKGQLKWGLYFAVKVCSEASVTFFHQDGDKPVHKKFPMSCFLTEDNAEGLEETLAAVAKGLGRSARSLRTSLRVLANLLSDSEYVRELTTLDEEINSLTQ